MSPGQAVMLVLLSLQSGKFDNNIRERDRDRDRSQITGVIIWSVTSLNN